MYRRIAAHSAACIILSVTILAAGTADAALSLSDAAAQAWTNAPERTVTEADRASESAAYAQARTWPQPRLALRADNAVALDRGASGYAWRSLELIQPLAVRARSAESARARLALAATDPRAQLARLTLEREVALRYHRLQWAQAKLSLAEDRRTRIDAAVQRRDRLVRYLKPSERLRLQIVQAVARNAVEAAEGEAMEAATQLRVILGAVDTATPNVVPLAATPAPRPLDGLQAQLARHPALINAQAQIDIAHADVRVARVQRWPDPELVVYRSRDYLNGAERDVTGAGVNIELPLWNRSAGVAKARAGVQRADAQRLANERELRAALAQRYAHLGHLRASVDDYARSVLPAAEKVENLTRADFAAGSSSVLALIDAGDTHYTTREHYLDLLHESWIELAELRYAAGESLATEAAP